MTHHQIYLGLGSNVERETHIEIALKMLEEHLENIRCSPVYESISLDGDHPPFFNLVISATTDLSLREFVAWLKGIEHLHGRRSGMQRLIALDIDLLLFDGLTGNIDGIQLPRAEILTRSFVLYPLQLLAPKLHPPGYEVSLAELWLKLRPGPELMPVRYPFGVPPYQLVGSNFSAGRSKSIQLPANQLAS
ncbi:2-amino-4-hydroxy-6-hydroxymethyldihydropteridine diphosphokinase [Pseudomonas azotoformans]|uniref:2-amino-4-hydroxy-6- hydroxymethyldihydropteridine diphosphokinase n=1 Tax=Pseudomonas azotoformans TaxID=47878 RepID=UPI00098EAB33|nr:2-amino-4-hydroxy-6-hydroxymethyldihydropteridine diphosphokinase [Pseudomonas azotoformans]AQT97469.1 2-amino-4-hydroxy-6-hydroxymethyldihydropteridine diphosphokinase [Pseudomonas azotoformans]UMY47049.1 2-amino-4-hydroxy-6-hydroxymethyldihydropteridine diphosphokinase [Pseudomonas azotoformans]